MLQSALDYETIPSYLLTIAAQDSGLPPLSSTASLIINLLDANDNPPVFSGTETMFTVPEVGPSTYTLIIRELTGKLATYVFPQNIGLGLEVLNVDATDEDSGSNADIRYRLVNVGGDNSPFVLDEVSGSLSLQQPLDRETISQYSVRKY